MDGKRGTASRLIKKRTEKLIQQRCCVYERQEKECEQLIRHQVMIQIHRKYVLQKVRMKISLKALYKHQTILEHWIH